MEQYKTDAQTAMNHIGKLHDELAEQFMDVWRKIPTFGGPVDREVRVYADGLGNWVRGNDTWSFEVSPSVLDVLSIWSWCGLLQNADDNN